MKACDGIAYAHSKGVVHRDLKPDNVMVGEYGEVLVMDWGLAKVRSGRVGSEPASQPETESRRAGEEAREADTIAEGTASRESDTATPQQSDSSTAPSSQPSAAVSSVRSDVQEALTMEGAVHGTPQYMPPEQAEGKLDEIDQRSDIYSLGAILYEMLTLKRPISGKTPQEILLKVVEHRIDPPEKSAPNRNIPRELSAIAMKAMAGHRRNRYQSVSELQDDINLYMSGRAVSAKEDTAFEAICKLIKRNKGIAATAAVVIIAVAVVLSVAYKNVGTQISIAQSALADTQANESKARASTGKQREDAKAAAKRFSMQAARAAEANRFIETERRLSDAESVFSDSPYIFYARGKYSEVRKQTDEAEDFYKRAIAADSSISEARNALAQLQALRGELTDASDLLAGAEQETDWKNLLRTAKLLYRAGKYPESAQVNARAVALMEKAADTSTEKDNKELNALIGLAKYSVEDEKARIASRGFAEEVKALDAHATGNAARKKLQEIHGNPDLNGQLGWQYADDTKEPHEVYIHHWNDLKYIHPLKGLPIQKLTLTHMTNVRHAHALIGMPLKYLNVRATHLADLSPLSRLPLEYLNISYAPHLDLGALRGMKLKTLYMGDTRVTDLLPLSDMTTLETLDIVHIWPMKDISPLKNLRLKKFYMTYTSVTDISAVKDMPLEEFTMFNTPVSDISALKGKKLVRYDTSPHVKDLSPIIGMPIQEMNVCGSAIFRMRIVKDMPIEKLIASNAVRVVDLSALAGKPLSELMVDGTKVSDLTPIAGCPLKRLAIDESEVTDLSPLKDQNVLDRFSLGGTKVSDLSPLAGLPLTQININATKVTDISPLVKCEKLRAISARKTDISDISSVKEMKELMSLYLSGTKVTSLEALRGTRIHRLSIQETAITDLAPLEDLKYINDLRIGVGQEFTEASKQILEKLRERRVTIRLCKKGQYHH